MMKSYQQQYAEITRELIENPDKVSGSRIGDINSKFSIQLRVDLQKEFPLMDIKKIKFSNIVHELLWMIKGDTNIKYLVENRCHIWTDDAYRYYKEKYAEYDEKVLSKDEFKEKVLGGDTIEIPASNGHIYTYGDLDKVYGYQWRNFGEKNVDQLSEAIRKIKETPLDRRIIITAHNPSDIIAREVGLPSCHNYFQFYVIPVEDGKNILNTFCNIRSNDWFLGQPYNMAQYALLTHIVAKMTGCEVGELVINSVDAHLYHAHFDAAKEWLERYNKVAPKQFLKIDVANIDENDIEEYVSKITTEFKRQNFVPSRDGVNVTQIDNTYCTAQIEISDSVQYINDFDEINAHNFILKNYEPQSFIKAPLLT